MRVLIGAAPAYGHFAPILPTARALVAAGHDVKVATHAGFHPVVEEAGLTAVHAGMADAEMVAARRTLWPETVGRPPSEWAVRMFARIAAPAMLADLDPIVREWRPDLIIHDEGEYASPVAAAAAGVPAVAYGWGSPLRDSAELARLADDVEGLWASRGLAVPGGGGFEGRRVIDPCPATLQPDVDPFWTRLPVRYEPYAPDGRSPGNPNVPHGRPLAYVGFGTTPMYRDAPAPLLAITRALLDEGFAVLVTVGDSGLATALRQLAPERVQVERFVSLPAALAVADLVVCHGGAGSTLAAIAAGLPLVLAPQGSPSQLRMANACVAAGVGHMACDIQAAMSAAMSDETRRRAKALAREIAAMPAATSLVEELERLS